MPYSTLVSTAQLAGQLNADDWVVIDCRNDLFNPEAGPADYAKSHIPGARFLSMDHDLSGNKTGKNGRHPLPEPADLASKLGAAGVGPGTQVVAYDAQDGVNATRLWWMLRWLGHPAAAVLDGGWGKWSREGRPVTNEVPQPTPAVFKYQPSKTWVDVGYVQGHLESPEMLLIDARAPERHRGEVEPIDPIAGHIPGAVCRLFKQNLDSDGCYLPAERLRAEFQALLQGRSPSIVVHSCGSGVSACNNLLAMEIAGLSGSRLYPGSWSEWCADPSRPIARG